MIGLDPRPFNFRQLLTMADGKRMNDGAMHRELLAAIHNAPHYQFKKYVTPEDFEP